MKRMIMLFTVLAFAGLAFSQTPTLVLNEFMASNDAATIDPDEDDDDGDPYDDWIEIFNGGTDAVDIGGMYITDDLEAPTEWQIPDTAPDLTTIAAGGFILLWADKETQQGILHVNIKLSGDGEQIGLYASDGVTVIDSLTFGAQYTDVSMGLFDDAWDFTVSPTPGAENVYTEMILGCMDPEATNYDETANVDDGSCVYPASPLYINEFMADQDAIYADAQGEFDDWVEVYNASDSTIDLAGMIFSDGSDSDTIPSGYSSITTVGAQDYIIVWFDKDSEDGPLHVEAKLSDGGESIIITDVDGTVLDSYTFGAQTLNVSEGRSFDSGHIWGNFVTPTPDSSNGMLYINEFMASNETTVADDSSEYDDWVEIYNTSSLDVDLAGLGFADDHEDAHFIPSGYTETVVPAGGYTLVWFDKESEEGPLHIEEKLGGGGDAVFLYDTTGVRVIDSYTFGAQYTDVSMGLFDDAWDFTVSPTPGSANVYTEMILGCMDPEATNYDETANVDDGSCEYPVVYDVVLNEFMASNDTTIADTSGAFEDWVEIYNPGDEAIDLAGLTFSDGEDGSTIPEGYPEITTIPAGGFLFIWFDKDPEEGPLHIDAKLSSGGESVIIYDIDGVTVIDSLTFGAQYTDVSMGLFDDAWDFTVSPTPGSANVYTEMILGCMDPEATNYDETANVDDGSCEYPTISLTTGWNIFSGFVTPEDVDLLSVVQPLIDADALDKVIDEAGNTIIYFFSEWVNNIGDFASTEGYYIKVSADADLSITGTPVALPFDIDLASGWNIMGYPTETAQDAIDVVQPLIDAEELDKVIDEAGNTIIYFFSEWVNNIGDFAAGEGYYIKVNTTTSLTISAPALASSETQDRIAKTVQETHFTTCWAEFQNPYMPMNFWVIGEEDAGFAAGDEVALFDGELCVGAGIVESVPVSITNSLNIITSQDDGIGQLGFTIGNPITIKIWDESGGNEIVISSGIVWYNPSTGEVIPEPMFEGLGFAAFTLATVGIDDEPGLPEVFALRQNYPNPFNPVTAIKFDLAEASDVNLVIYDLLGHEIATLVNDRLNAGYHNVVWNGTDRFGKLVSTGMYIYRITAGDITSSKKMVLLK